MTHARAHRYHRCLPSPPLPSSRSSTALPRPFSRNYTCPHEQHANPPSTPPAHRPPSHPPPPRQQQPQHQQRLPAQRTSRTSTRSSPASRPWPWLRRTKRCAFNLCLLLSSLVRTSLLLPHTLLPSTQPLLLLFTRRKNARTHARCPFFFAASSTNPFVIAFDSTATTITLDWIGSDPFPRSRLPFVRIAASSQHTLSWPRPSFCFRNSVLLCLW